MTLPVRERQVRLLADSRATEPRARLAQASSRAEFVLRLSRTVSAVQHPSRAMEALVGLLVEEMVAFAQVTVFSGVRQITTGMVHEGRATTRAGLAVDTRMPVVEEVVRHGVIEQLLLPSGPERRGVVDQLVPETALAEALDALGAESLVLLPLVARGRTFGALALARPAGYGFDENALGFLEDLAQRVSVALDANLVVAESRHVASVLRRTMMPTTTRSVPYLDTAVFLRVAHEHEELGGDFYDLHGEDDDLTVLLGDVAGKGVEAAVHAKRIRNAVRTASHVDRDPAWILGLVNRVLSAEAEPLSEVISTAVCARLRPGPDSLVVEIANAGHPPALVLRVDGTVETVTAEGVALALLDDTTYAPTTVELRAGDTLLCYTDGVTEAHGSEDLFGEQRLVDVLGQLGGVKASAVVDQVAIAVTTHLAHRQRDDIALVALRYVPDRGMTGTSTTPIRPDDLDTYWEAVSTGDERACHALVDELLARGASVVDVFSAVVIPIQQQVGERWANNDWTVAHEHAATAISEAVVSRLGAGIPEPATDERPLLVTCAEREWHALPALVVTHTLRSWGHPVHYLGSNVSPETVVGRIIDLGPRAVLVSASLSSSLPRVRRLIEAVSGTGTPVILGGRAFDSGGVRAARLGGTAYAPDMDRLPRVLADLPGHVPPAPQLRHPGVGEALAILAAADEISRDVIRGSEVDLGSAGTPAAMPPDDWRVVLATYVPHVIGCVVGGLLAEDPTVPGEARAWLTTVLALRGGDPDAVDHLWRALAHRLREYPEAVRLLESS